MSSYNVARIECSRYLILKSIISVKRDYFTQEITKVISVRISSPRL